MKLFSWIRHFIKLQCDFQKSDWSGCLQEYTKLAVRDNLPTKKFLNYDEKILDIAKKIRQSHGIIISPNAIEKDQKKVAILTSEIYDTGGHTELAIRFINKNKKDKNIYFILTAFNQKSELSAPTKSKTIKELVGSEKYVEFDGVKDYAEKVIQIFNYIKENNFSTVISNIHMHDAVGTAILGLIHTYSDIKIEFWNHGDHFFALGTSFADVIYTRTKNGQAVSPYLRNNSKCKNGEFIIQYDKSKILTKEELAKIRESLNIPQNAFLTLTGCQLEKLGNEYFKLVNTILKKNPNIWHLFITPSLSYAEKTIKKNFKNNPRVILMNGTPEFEKFIQISDLYIDSFPQGSALTLIDCIKYKKPVVIKINEKEPIRSFEEYLYPNYEYAFKTSKGMFNGISKLANDKNEYEKTSENVWHFFKNKYLEGNI